MQPQSYVPGAATAVVAALALALTGCTGSGDSGDGMKEEAAGSAAAPEAAPSGRYRTLPEPCTAVDKEQLRALLPQTATDVKNTASTRAREEALLGGKPALTFDTDRRVGCGWQRVSVEGSRQLRLDFERVVSYDPAVSDEVRAAQVFRRKAQEHGVTARDLPKGPQPSAPSGSGGPGELVGESGAEVMEDGAAAPSTPDPKPGTDAAAGTDAGTDAAAGTAPPATPTPSASPAAPLVLEGPGDEAFLAERAGTTQQGQRRVVSVIFRTANVVVTVEYGQSTTGATALPDSAELQRRAQELAGKLAGDLME
ncbi:hypothetical protein ACFQLX_19585 [Streptomyces polyrhachis]|uniref:DUF3558 domain-containing protein n=1 Tax=Streptomyces polyrhachis TaxID=1282885 RepID=A0ABW2GMP9_9ACTN